MVTGFRRDPLVGNILALIALFIALGAGAYAAGLAPDSVKSKHIVNDQVKSADVRDDVLAGGGLTGADIAGSPDLVDAAQLGGLSASAYMPCGGSGCPITAQVKWYSAFIDTGGSGQTFDFGSRLDLQNTGTADQVQVCNALNSARPFVVYTGATRNEVSVNGNSCSSAFTIPDNGDFRVTGNGTVIFGQQSGDSATSNGYIAYGFSIF